MSMYNVHAQCPEKLEGGVRSPENGVTDSCMSSCRCWEWNLGLLAEQPVRKQARSPAPPIFKITE